MISDVVIVGSGLSGLSTAFYIKQHHPNVNITILEKSDRCGGRLYSQDGKEYGAEVLGSYCKKTMGMCEKVGVDFTKIDQSTMQEVYDMSFYLKGDVYSSAQMSDKLDIDIPALYVSDILCKDKEKPPVWATAVADPENLGSVSWHDYLQQNHDVSS